MHWTNTAAYFDQTLVRKKEKFHDIFDCLFVGMIFNGIAMSQNLYVFLITDNAPVISQGCPLPPTSNICESSLIQPEYLKVLQPCLLETGVPIITYNTWANNSFYNLLLQLAKQIFKYKTRMKLFVSNKHSSLFCQITHA